jgi:hypothetical protein
MVFGALKADPSLKFNIISCISVYRLGARPDFTTVRIPGLRPPEPDVGLPVKLVLHHHVASDTKALIRIKLLL